MIGELPTGTVTLLLADVEGSTRLWQAQPEVLAASIDTHHAQLITRLKETPWRTRPD